MEDLEQPIASAPNCEPVTNIEVGGQDNQHDTSSYASSGRDNSQPDRTTDTQMDEINAGKGSKEYGKFASSEELLKAYNNLQAEFTRKCQALNAKTNDSSQRPSDVIKGIKQAVDDFSASHPLAQKYASHMTQILIDDDSPLTNERLTKAYVDILEKHFVSPADLIKDEEFLSNYIYSDQNICDQIVSKYLSKVASGDKTPLITKSSRSSASLRQINTPRSVYEAGEIAKRIIHKQ